MSFPQHRVNSTVPPQALKPFFQCIHCPETSTLPDDIVDRYIQGQNGICQKCGGELDWWNVALRMVKRNFMYFEAFYPLGVNSTLFQTKFFRDAISHFNLFEEGLPPNAFILEVNITPQGMFCSETTTNSRRLSNRFNKGGNLQLHGYADPDSANLLDEADVAIYVTWVERSPDDTAWNNLVSAFDFYVDGDYEYSLVPANVAVESRLFRFIAKHLGAQIAGPSGFRVGSPKI